MPTVLGYIGDSLTVQNGGAGPANIAATLVPLGFNGTNSKIDGLVGRSISQNVPPWPSPGTIQVMQAWRAGGFHPNYWLMAVSSNDFDASISTLQTRIELVLTEVALEPRDKVLWVGPAIQPVPTTITNAQVTNIYTALNNVAATHPEMIVYDIRAAYNAYDPVQAGWWTDDRHMTNTGYGIRNNLIAGFIQANLPPPSTFADSAPSAWVNFTIRDKPTGGTPTIWTDSAPSAWVQFTIVDDPVGELPYSNSPPSAWVQFTLPPDPTPSTWGDSPPSPWVTFTIIDDPSPYADSQPSGWVVFTLPPDPYRTFTDSPPSPWVIFSIIDNPDNLGSGIYLVNAAGDLVQTEVSFG